MNNTANIFAEEYNYVVAFDYDGVITVRGSSDNEEKWHKREKNIIWRKLMNLASAVYNRFIPYNEEVIDLIKFLKENNCKVIVISSHTLTGSNYKESYKSRKRVKKTMTNRGVKVDEVIFAYGDKVYECINNKVALMIEDNVSKVKAIRDAGIRAVPKITEKNKDLLVNDPSAINNLSLVKNLVNKLILEKDIYTRIKRKKAEINSQEEKEINLQHELNRYIPQLDTLQPFPTKLVLRKK